MTAHAKLSPSAASRWLECTGAPSLEAQFEEKPSEYAAEGTDAHILAEIETRYALGDINDEEYANDHDYFVSESAYYTEEMQEAAEDYAAFIKEMMLEYAETCDDPVHELEVKLDLTAYVPEGFGTADCVLISDGVLHIIDFKYGKGVKVEADGNAQMKLYALGAYDFYGALYDIKDVKMSIVQPRLGGVSTSAITLQGLVDWGLEFVEPRAKNAYEGKNIKFAPGEDTCRFCRASGSCKAQAEYFLDLFEENEAVDLLSVKDKGELLKKADGLSTWLNALQDAVFAALMNGEKVDGWKLVEGKSNRKYTDEEAIAKKLRSKGYKVGQIYEKKLLGLSKMEKLVGKKKLSDLCGDLIVKPKGKPTLVPASDKRPAYSREEEITKAFDEE